MIKLMKRLYILFGCLIVVDICTLIYFWIESIWFSERMLDIEKRAKTAGVLLFIFVFLTLFFAIRSEILEEKYKKKEKEKSKTTQPPKRTKT